MFQILVQWCAWLVEASQQRVDWRCFMMTSGELCALITLATLRPLLFAGCLASEFIYKIEDISPIKLTV